LQLRLAGFPSTRTDSSIGPTEIPALSLAVRTASSWPSKRQKMVSSGWHEVGGEEVDIVTLAADLSSGLGGSAGGVGHRLSGHPGQ
jgi:hypothetical protein